MKLKKGMKGVVGESGPFPRLHSKDLKDGLAAGVLTRYECSLHCVRDERTGVKYQVCDSAEVTGQYKVMR